MNEKPGCDLASETARLLSELELALEHYSTIRTIARYRDQLHDLESLTGPSLKTRSLRAEIRLLERRLGDAREVATAFPATSLLSA
jgi:hypothetical protein